MVMKAELDWLFNEGELGQPELCNKNVKNHHNRSSTNKPNEGPSVALEEEGDEEMSAEIGSCRGPNSFL